MFPGKNFIQRDVGSQFANNIYIALSNLLALLILQLIRIQLV